MGQNYQQEGPHPKEIYNCIQQLCLDAKTASQTTYIALFHSITIHEFNLQNSLLKLGRTNSLELIIPFCLIDSRYMYGTTAPG